MSCFIKTSSLNECIYYSINSNTGGEMAITDIHDIELVMQNIVAVCKKKNAQVVWEMYDAYEIFSQGELDTQVVVFDKGVLIPFYTQYTDGSMFIARTLVRYIDNRFPEEALLRNLYDICVPAAYAHNRGFFDFNSEEITEAQYLQSGDSIKKHRKKTVEKSVPFETAFMNNTKAMQYRILRGLDTYDMSLQKSVTHALASILGGKAFEYSALVTSMRNHGLIESSLGTGRSIPNLTQKGRLMLEGLTQEVTLCD